MPAVEVTFRFRNKWEKDKFLKELADGFGEEHCQMSWGQANGITLTDAKLVDVTPWGPFEEDDDEFDDFGLERMAGDTRTVDPGDLGIHDSAECDNQETLDR